MTVLQILTYISLLSFIVMCAVRFYRIATSPMHLRWELYPVPHEKGRSQYGGSILEEVDWWTKKREKDHLGELKVMIPEILFLKAVWEHNRPLWFGSFTFHFGLYLFMGNIALLIVASILSMTGTPVNTESTALAGGIYYGIIGCTFLGGLLGALGSVRLIFQRMVDHNLSLYSTPSHYFNLVLIGAMFVTGILWMFMDSTYVSNLTGFYTGMITFSGYPALPAIAIWHIGITILFLFYLPMTHMTHFFTKYFTYHKIRWDDEPNLTGAKMQGEIAELLNQKVTWAAEHIGADGNKNWIALASESPNKESKNDK